MNRLVQSPLGHLQKEAILASGVGALLGEGAEAATRRNVHKLKNFTEGKLRSSLANVGALGSDVKNLASRLAPGTETGTNRLIDRAMGVVPSTHAEAVAHHAANPKLQAAAHRWADSPEAMGLAAVMVPLPGGVAAGAPLAELQHAIKRPLRARLKAPERLPLPAAPPSPFARG